MPAAFIRKLMCVCMHMSVCVYVCMCVCFLFVCVHVCWCEFLAVSVFLYLLHQNLLLETKKMVC